MKNQDNNCKYYLEKQSAPGSFSPKKKKFGGYKFYELTEYTHPLPHALHFQNTFPVFFKNSRKIQGESFHP